MLTALLKAATAVVLSPVAVVVDVCMMPGDAMDDRPAFPRTRGLLSTAAEHVTHVVASEDHEGR